MLSKNNRNKLLGLVVLLGFGLFNYLSTNTPHSPPTHEPSKTHELSTKSSISEAFKRKQSDLQVQGEGIVIRLLKDDLQGLKHQKFLLRLKSGETILIAHNIDLAPRINDLKKGDSVAFYGEYEYNEKGGVLHWTHHDPKQRHENGWLKHNNKIYQ
ncbi:MAG: DUF3465 domain-containing protein [Sulfurimonas sp.]|nr:DUF3465 domain-containing protein [Sulfurimonas sp.]